MSSTSRWLTPSPLASTATRPTRLRASTMPMPDGAKAGRSGGHDGRTGYSRRGRAPTAPNRRRMPAEPPPRPAGRRPTANRTETGSAPPLAAATGGRTEPRVECRCRSSIGRAATGICTGRGNGRTRCRWRIHARRQRVTIPPAQEHRQQARAAATASRSWHAQAVPNGGASNARLYCQTPPLPPTGPAGPFGSTSSAAVISVSGSVAVSPSDASVTGHPIIPTCGHRKLLTSTTEGGSRCRRKRPRSTPSVRSSGRLR